jgi:hypothetical protein
VRLHHVRLPKELAAWLEAAARKAGIFQGKRVRDQLEKAPAASGAQAFMNLAGCVHGRTQPVEPEGIRPFLRGIADPGFLVAFANRTGEHLIRRLQSFRGVSETGARRFR